MKKTNAIILTAIATLLLSSAPSEVYAQSKSSTAKKPAWVTKAPTVKGSYIGIVSVPKRSMSPSGEQTESTASSIIVSQLFFNEKYKESGRREAEKAILKEMHLAVDPNSLLGDLIVQEKYAPSSNQSFDDVFIDRVFATPLLKKQGEWENDDEYWCYYSITEKDCQARLKSLEDSICGQAETMWKLGMSYQKDGMLFNAAKTFTEALNLIHPLIYTQHKIKYDYENVDLFSSIYKSYISVYDDITLTCSVNEIPAVAGEAVPATFKVKVEQKGTPVRKLGIVIEYPGTTDGAFMTDDNGEAAFSIVKAADEAEQAITISLDKDGIYGLPETYVFKQLTSKADKLKSTKATVKLFDPNNYISLHVQPQDSATQKAVTELISARKDLIIVDDDSKADLILVAKPAIMLEAGADPKAKWPIDQYSAAMSVQVREKASDKELFQYTIDNFQYLSPAGRDKNQVLHSAAKEMSRQMIREFPEQFKSFSYDKRGLVWSIFK